MLSNILKLEFNNEKVLVRLKNFINFTHEVVEPMSVEPFLSKTPKIHEKAYVHPLAILIGDVEVGAYSSIWPGAVVRGDMEPIRIGARTSIQDNAVVHTDYGFPTIIGDDVTVGHCCVIHGCVIGNFSLVGMGAKVLTGAKVGERSIIGAGAVVTEGQEVPSGSVCVGIPARVIRKVSDDDFKRVKNNVEAYVELAMRYKLRNKR